MLLSTWEIRALNINIKEDVVKKILILSLLSACAGLQSAGLRQDIPHLEFKGIRFVVADNVMGITSELEDQKALDQLTVADVDGLVAKAEELRVNNVIFHDFEGKHSTETFKNAGFKVKARNEGYVVLEKAVN